MNISIFGIGKLGIALAAAMASKGHQVIGVDVNDEIVEKVNSNVAPFPETDLQKYLEENRERIKAVKDPSNAIKNSEVSFILVPTPSTDDGSFNNSYIFSVLGRANDSLKDKEGFHLFVVSSTVSPGSMKEFESFLEQKTGKKCGEGFGLCYGPCFIRQGSIIRDFIKPEILLIGESDERSGSILEKLWKSVVETSPHISRMNFINAEISKIALNCYVTMKISFANSLAYLCEHVHGADSDEITDAIGADGRIGEKYFKGGLGFGGPCFPRDNSAFGAFAKKTGVEAELANVVDKVNKTQPMRIVKKIESILKEGKNKKISESKIAVLGLSYKPDTQIIEESQAIRIIKLLREKGASVKVYDPLAMEEAEKVLGSEVEYAESAQGCIDGTDFCVITTPWNQFKEIDFKDETIFDCWGLLKNVDLPPGVSYVGWGRSRKA